MKDLSFRQYLDYIIGNLYYHKDDIQWVIDNGVKAKRIANFGCNIGNETLRLMYLFKADYVVGLDIDPSNIHQAKKELINTLEEIRLINNRMTFYQDNIEREDINWWNNDVPSFLKIDLIKNCENINYFQQDICQPSVLPSSNFNLAYCNFVLHHIWLNENSDNGENDTLNAIAEMHRVVKLGGYIAVRELIDIPNKFSLDFEYIFSKINICQVYKRIKAMDNNAGHWAEYLYMKMA